MRKPIHVLVLMLAFALPASAQTRQAAGPIKAAVSRPFPRNLAAVAHRNPAPTHRQATSTREWIHDHPILFGTTVGLAAGLVIGAASGDDGIFNDFTRGFNAVAMGGIGAGAGAIVGAAVASK